jgi:hypothetical protein
MKNASMILEACVEINTLEMPETSSYGPPWPISLNGKRTPLS